MIWLALFLFACSEDEPLCPTPETVLASSPGSELTCATADRAADFVEVLAVRSISKADRELFYAALQIRFEGDAAGTLADLEQASAQAELLSTLTGFEAAELRSKAVYAAFKRRGPLMGTDDVVVSTVARTAQQWTKDDETELALTELDVEGWLFYASLCREAQGGSPLRLSVADRVPAYQVVNDAFDSGSREEQIALASMGPFWKHVKESWAMASYDEQQAWIAAAPLPPPMTASSLGYFEAVFAKPASEHAVALHTALGPLVIKAPK